MTAYRIEETFAGAGWLTMPKVYLDVTEAEAKAKAMAEAIPPESKPRRGYQTRVIVLGTNQVLRTFVHEDPVDNGPFDDDPVAARPPSAAQILAVMRERDGQRSFDLDEEVQR